MSTSNCISLKFNVASTDYSAPLGIRVKLNDDIIFEQARLLNELQIQHQLSDDDGEHELTFEMFGKQIEHTRIDDVGNVMSDATLYLSEIKLDDIDIDQIVQFYAVYTHDFNSTQPLSEHKFYGSLGCNGTVRLKFATPVYLWLLENM